MHIKKKSKKDDHPSNVERNSGDKKLSTNYLECFDSDKYDYVRVDIPERLRQGSNPYESVSYDADESSDYVDPNPEYYTSKECLEWGIFLTNIKIMKHYV